VSRPSDGRFRLREVIDGIVCLSHGRVGLIDDKATGQPIDGHSDFGRRLRVDSQIGRYGLAARESGFPASEVVYGTTRKPSIRPRRLIARLRSDGIDPEWPEGLKCRGSRRTWSREARAEDSIQRGRLSAGARWEGELEMSEEEEHKLIRILLRTLKRKQPPLP
jgi:hypothetical protein